MGVVGVVFRVVYMASAVACVAYWSVWWGVGCGFCGEGGGVVGGEGGWWCGGSKFNNDL